MEPLYLPKGYLSYSQMTTWQQNKKRYISEYFEKGKRLDTRELRFGKSIAKMIEDGEHKELLPNLEVYSIVESEHRTVIEGVPTLSYLDTEDPSLNLFKEFKTGKNPWTQAKVEKHKQLPFYATVLTEVRGKRPEYCDLEWIETEDFAGDGFWGEVDKSIRVTGRIVSFRRYFLDEEIEAMRQEIRKTAEEISEAYKLFISEL